MRLIVAFSFCQRNAELWLVECTVTCLTRHALLRALNTACCFS